MVYAVSTFILYIHLSTLNEEFEGPGQAPACGSSGQPRATQAAKHRPQTQGQLRAQGESKKRERHRQIRQSTTAKGPRRRIGPNGGYCGARESHHA